VEKYGDILDTGCLGTRCWEYLELGGKNCKRMEKIT